MPFVESASQVMAIIILVAFGIYDIFSPFFWFLKTIAAFPLFIVSRIARGVQRILAIGFTLVQYVNCIPYSKSTTANRSSTRRRRTSKSKGKQHIGAQLRDLVSKYHSFIGRFYESFRATLHEIQYCYSLLVSKPTAKKPNPYPNGSQRAFHYMDYLSNPVNDPQSVESQLARRCAKQELAQRGTRSELYYAQKKNIFLIQKMHQYEQNQRDGAQKNYDTLLENENRKLREEYEQYKKENERLRLGLALFDRTEKQLTAAREKNLVLHSEIQLLRWEVDRFQAASQDTPCEIARQDPFFDKTTSYSRKIVMSSLTSI